MKKIIIALVLMCLMAAAVSAGELVINDQYNAGIHLRVRDNTDTGIQTTIWQNFTSAENLEVTGVKINVLGWNSDGEFYVTLSQSIGGAILASKTTTYLDNEGDPTGEVTIYFDTPYNITSGEQYWIAFIPVSSDQDAWIAYDDTPDNYVSGSCWSVPRTWSGGWHLGSPVSCDASNAYPTEDTSDLFLSVMYTSPCVPDWVCSGYAACLVNDTKLCNAATDTNLCGESYSGDYTEFEAGICDYCAPQWACESWLWECQPNNINPCITPTDPIGCYAQTGLPSDEFGGVISELDPLPCDYCTPNWNCTSFGECILDTKECLAVGDLNTCSEPFEGNLENYAEACITPPPNPYIYGSSTNLSAVENISAVPDFTIETPASLLVFSVPVDLSETGDVSDEIYVTDGAIIIDVVENPSLNVSADVSLNISTLSDCEGFTLYYAVGSFATREDLIAAGTVVATADNIGGDCTDASICTNVECTGGVLTFHAEHFDGFGVGEEEAPPITGYVSQYSTQDFRDMVIDFIGSGAAEVVGWVGMIVLVGVIGYGISRMRKTGGK